ncbi:hypothetical protein OG533_39710 (plasmid) [Streptomyces sp. NBC_01186]|uniref:hypothetical protein n=1 Tax=Streptomyces sp. NBC_01186 TaxID=2903765 RepID=UPI002E13B561|nr:hypothetical protein OG533_39710 [Streptomyces sp. NBC_01186]
MAMGKSRHQDTSGQSARWILGAVLCLQGFGTAVTEALWATGFGVAGLFRAAGFPSWTDFVVGAAGLALLIWAMVHRAGRRPTRA